MVVDAVDFNVLVAPCASQLYDLTTTTEAALLDIDMPLDFIIRMPSPPPALTFHAPLCALRRPPAIDVTALTDGCLSSPTLLCLLCQLRLEGAAIIRSGGWSTPFVAIGAIC